MDSPEAELAQCSDKVGRINYRRNCICRGLFDMGVVKYAICGAILCSIVGGAYYLGYKAGANNTRVEYVTKEKEVIRYIAKETANIQAKPNATKKQLLDLMKNNML